ncbi:terpene synthase family protein [Spirillospora sp. NPDC048911]|uniref:terpene synthase family protein n=1 Tax=Spirillospora sp. NPDC048911 TaxID=3364527 RepID=UPI0037196D85
MRIERFAERALPEAGRADQVLIAQWTAFICLVDDELDVTPMGGRPEQVGSAMHRLVDVLEQDGHDEVRSPAETALADLWRRTAPRMTGGLRDRFIAHYRDFVEATHEEALARASGTRLSLSRYLRQRHRSITAHPMLDLVESTYPVSLPDEWHSRSAVRALRDAAVDTVGWVNDLVSAGPELTRGQDNLLTVLARERGCSYAEARSTVVAMLGESRRKFDQAAAELSQTPDGRRYAASLCSYLDAVLSWLSETARFEQTEDLMAYGPSLLEADRESGP